MKDKMKMFMYMNKFIIFLAYVMIKGGILCYSDKAEIVYKWVNLDFEWQSEDHKNNALNNKTFIPENNLMTGIKVYNNRVFVTVPRWRLGVPATLNEVVRSTAGNDILRPYPSWSWQTVGKCSVFQYIQSMEIDINTGYMWIIDTGSINTADTSGRRSLCPAKLLIYNIKKEEVVRRHNFPDNIVSKDTNFLNDIVIDYRNGKAAFAYISDAGPVPKIVVYDFERDESYYFQHKTMESKKPYQIRQGGKLFSTNVPIDGIAMSPDFSRVFFSTITGKELYAIPTFVLRNREETFSKNVIEAGVKMSRSDGMIFSQNALYMSSLNSGSVYRRSLSNLITVQNDTELFTSTEPEMNWVDTFAIDEKGDLWFTVNNINLFFSGAMNFSDNSGENMFIWKAAIDEAGYLADAPHKTLTNSAMNLSIGNDAFILILTTMIFMHEIIT